MEQYRIEETPTYYIMYNDRSDDVEFGFEEFRGIILVTEKEHLETYRDEINWRRRLYLFGYTDQNIDEVIENG